MENKNIRGNPSTPNLYIKNLAVGFDSLSIPNLEVNKIVEMTSSKGQIKTT